nr:DUF3168 domain-containing protein [Brevundimonas naejangsanensis]
MKDHEGALVKALIEHLRGDGALQALLGDPMRVWDEPPQGAGFPHLVIGRCESRPLNADGGGVEHRLTLTCASQFRGWRRRGRWRRRCARGSPMRRWRRTE